LIIFPSFSLTEAVTLFHPSTYSLLKIPQHSGEVLLLFEIGVLSEIMKPAAALYV